MIKDIISLVKGAGTQLRSMYMVFSHGFRKRDTIQYPEEKVYLPPRYRGRIVLTRDPDGEERCVACNLCAVACPVGCISLQKAERDDGRWYPEFFRINFSRCIFCGLCEEACPTTAIQLTPDFEMGEYRRQDLVSGLVGVALGELLVDVASGEGEEVMRMRDLMRFMF